MGENHSAAAIAGELKVVHSVAFRVLLLDKLNVHVPLVADDFTAGEATDGDNHFGFDERVETRMGGKEVGDDGSGGDCILETKPA